LGDLRPENVIKRKKTVCSGFINLFAFMANHADLPTKAINVHAKGAGYKFGDRFKGLSNHAWNIIMLDNKWYLLESTWARCVKQSVEYYFLSPPEKFIIDHWPSKKKWQLLDKPITLKKV